MVHVNKLMKHLLEKCLAAHRFVQGENGSEGGWAGRWANMQTGRQVGRHTGGRDGIEENRKGV